jgi:hypothetical protein
MAKKGSSWAPAAAQKKQTWQAKEAWNGGVFRKKEKVEDTQELKTYSFWFSWCSVCTIEQHLF